MTLTFIVEPSYHVARMIDVPWDWVWNDEKAAKLNKTVAQKECI
jgi:hypothetical protein